MTRKPIVILALAAGLALAVPKADAQVMLQKVVIAAGGNPSSNATTRVNATAGQAVIGMTASASAKAELGFWTSEKVANDAVSAAMATEDFTISAWPNPASGLTKIQVALPQSAALDVRLFDLNGREVKMLFNGASQSQSQAFNVDLSEIASGTYIIAARIPGEMVQKRISIIH